MPYLLPKYVFVKLGYSGWAEVDPLAFPLATGTGWYNTLTGVEKHRIVSSKREPASVLGKFRAVAVTDTRSGHGHKGHAVTDTSRRAPDPPAGRRARTAEKSWLSDRSHASDHAGHNFHRVRRVATHHTHAFQALALAPPTAMDAACARRAAIVWTC